MHKNINNSLSLRKNVPMSKMIGRCRTSGLGEDTIVEEHSHVDQTLCDYPTKRTFLVVDPENDHTIDWIDNVNYNDPNSGSVIEIGNFDEGVPAFPSNKKPLSWEQIQRLEKLLLNPFVVEGVSCPTLYVEPVAFIQRLKLKIRSVKDVTIESILIFGGVSSYIMDEAFPYNDLDILFNLHFEFEKRNKVFETLRSCIVSVLQDLLLLQLEDETPVNGQSRKLYPSHQLREGYFQKSIDIPQPHKSDSTESDDCWSLVCLRNLSGQNLEFKFVRCMSGKSTIKRHFEFSSDSFQIVLSCLYLDSLLSRIKIGRPEIAIEDKKDSTELEKIFDFNRNKQVDDHWVFPRVEVICVCTHISIGEAVHQLQQKYIKIWRPEELRGGGLLKYCYLKQHGFKNDPRVEHETLARAISQMVICFLMTSQEKHSQWNTVNKYLQTHFPTQQKNRLSYLNILTSVVKQCNVINWPAAHNLVQVIKALKEGLNSQMEVEQNQPSPHQSHRTMMYPLRVHQSYRNNYSSVSQFLTTKKNTAYTPFRQYRDSYNRQPSRLQYITKPTGGSGKLTANTSPWAVWYQ